MEVSPGKRAITIPIDDMRGVSKLLRPGDRIDIVAALDYGKGGDQRREVHTILQDVVVLATGLNVMNKIPRRFELDANGRTINRINLSANTTFTNITVEAQPEDVQKLVYILATAPGSIFTTLRHPNDRLQAPVRTTLIEDLMGKPVLMRTPAASGVAQPLPTMNQAPPQMPQQPIRPNTPPQPQRRGNFREL